MPTTFNDREQAFEAKFAHDEDFRFRVTARRDRLFARWAATRLRLSDMDAEALVKTVLAIPDRPGHDQKLLQCIAEAAAAHGGGLPEAELSAALEGCAQQARQQLLDAPLGPSASA